MAFLITILILAALVILIVVVVAFSQSSQVSGEGSESLNPENFPDFPQKNPDSKKYFELMGTIFQEKKKGNFSSALEACRKSLQHLPGALKDFSDGKGGVIVSSIPAIQEGFDFAAILQNRGALNEIKSLVGSVPELEGWTGLIEEAEEEFRLVPRIIEVIQKNPGIRQDKIKYEMEYVNGRKIATLIARMEKASLLRRERTKKALIVYPK